MFSIRNKSRLVRLDIPVAGCTVHCSDFETTGIQFFNLLLQVVRVFERIVPKVNIILKGERELALGEETTRCMVTVEPIEE